MPMGILDGRSILDGTATINNVQVAYAYFTGEDDSQNAEFVQVQNDVKFISIALLQTAILKIGLITHHIMGMSSFS